MLSYHGTLTCTKSPFVKKFQTLGCLKREIKNVLIIFTLGYEIITIETKLLALRSSVLISSTPLT